MTPIDLFKAGVVFDLSIYIYVEKNTELTELSQKTNRSHR